MAVKFPSDDQRVAVVGRTGSGKTTAGMWHLSGKDFFVQPWLIVNTKGDPLINEIAQIKGVQTIGIGDTPGDKGLFIVNPRPDEGMELNLLFHRVWEKQNCGVYIDEGYMVKPPDGMNALLTQGRSRKIPMIVLSQRPAWISKFVFTESDFIQIFALQYRGDRKTVAEFVPIDVNYTLPKYHSLWYNVGDNELVKFAPVPAKDQILNSFRAQFPPDDEQIPQSPAGLLEVPKRRARRQIVL